MKNMAQLYRSRIKTIEEGDTPDFHIELRPYQREAEEMIFAEGESRPAYLTWCRRAR